MPNWCSNLLVVRGPRALEFAEACRLGLLPADDLGEEGLAPDEAALDGELCPGDDEENDFTLELEGDCAKLYFDTAWEPPTDWLEAVAGEYPDLELELVYFEPANAFAGWAKYRNGVCTDGGEVTRDGDPRKYWELAGRLGYSPDMFGEEYD
ncbi:MAG: hypothetical protein ACPLRW_05570 [Moorellales bacterium]